MKPGHSSFSSRIATGPVARGTIAAAIAMAACLPLLAQSSAGYRLRGSSLSAAGGESAAAAHRCAGSLAQDTALVGVSAAFEHVVQSGFWGFAGSGLVPVVLTLDKSPFDATHPRLAWSGNNPPYGIHRATDCSAVREGPLTSRIPREWTDDAPPEAPLACYAVFATAPGPEVAPARMAP